eukprot:NODE_12_length_45166_cov_0.552511.p25 type:complete len:102 gc:universal NODE_12_length_45166_cov_0.552511:17422-17727(+)
MKHASTMLPVEFVNDIVTFSSQLNLSFIFGNSKLTFDKTDSRSATCSSFTSLFLSIINSILSFASSTTSPNICTIHVTIPSTHLLLPFALGSIPISMFMSL